MNRDLACYVGIGLLVFLVPSNLVRSAAIQLHPVAAVAISVDESTLSDFQYKAEGILIPAATADEPRVKNFDRQTIQAAAKYLDDGAVAWARSRKCIACHTTGVYLADRSKLTSLFGPPQQEVLETFLSRVPKADSKKTPKGHAHTAIWRSLGLAQWDKHVEGKLSEQTSLSLRDMLLRQADDGSWKLYPCTEIPHITTEFELAFQAARAINAAPGWLESIEDKDLLSRVDRLKKYLREHVPRNDYEKLIKLQLSNLMPELVEKRERENAIATIREYQQDDGGWSTRDMSELSNWQDTMDEKVIEMLRAEPDVDDPESDPYMTSFAIVLLKESGIPTEDPQIQKGIQWLKTNQRVSGRWWMKSLYRNTYHFSTYISTAKALQALNLCGELETVDTKMP